MPFDPNDVPVRTGSGGGSKFLPIGKHRVTATVQECGETIVLEFARQSDGMTIRGWFPVFGGGNFKLANMCRAVGWGHIFDNENIEECRAVFEDIPLEISVEVNDYVRPGAEPPKFPRTQVKWTNRLPGTEDRAPRTHAEGGPATPDDEIPF